MPSVTFNKISKTAYYALSYIINFASFMANVEKVVKDPKYPVIIIGLHGKIGINCLLVAPVINPMIRHPSKLGIKTLKGN